MWRRLYDGGNSNVEIGFAASVGLTDGSYHPGFHMILSGF
ncbi:hypothetical protein SBA3_2780018 [Candidatus Sulfopaludibacter sp. SbA3]|nr:hypothetical protein SBA3_2780018 [Candidatus Sulfopaludibacter sp. SbA3]